MLFKKKLHHKQLHFLPYFNHNITWLQHGFNVIDQHSNVTLSHHLSIQVNILSCNIVHYIVRRHMKMVDEKNRIKYSVIDDFDVTPWTSTCVNIVIP